MKLNRALSWIPSYLLLLSNTSDSITIGQKLGFWQTVLKTMTHAHYHHSNQMHLCTVHAHNHYIHRRKAYIFLLMMRGKHLGKKKKKIYIVIAIKILQQEPLRGHHPHCNTVPYHPKQLRYIFSYLTPNCHFVIDKHTECHCQEQKPCPSALKTAPLPTRAESTGRHLFFRLQSQLNMLNCSYCTHIHMYRLCPKRKPIKFQHETQISE